MRHRVVVVITALQRINLRPAAVGKLRGEDELESFDKSRFAILALGGVLDVGEKIHFLRGRAIIERGDVMRLLAGLVLRSPLHTGQARTFAETNVLGPTARRGLIREHRGGELPRLVAGIPSITSFDGQLEVPAAGRPEGIGHFVGACTTAASTSALVCERTTYVFHADCSAVGNSLMWLKVTGSADAGDKINANMSEKNDRVIKQSYQAAASLTPHPFANHIEECATDRALAFQAGGVGDATGVSGLMRQCRH